MRAIDWRESELPFEKAIRRLRTQLFIWGLVGPLPPQRGFVWGFRQRGESFVGTPVVANGIVYIGSASGALIALDASTGELIWQFNGDAGISTSPSIADQAIFVGDENGRLYSINALTGDIRWRFLADAAISSTPVIANGTLYIASKGGTLYAIR